MDVDFTVALMDVASAGVVADGMLERRGDGGRGDDAEDFVDAVVGVLAEEVR